MRTSNDQQVGGDHYHKGDIQPWDFVVASNLDFFQGNILKYITRWKHKAGLTDLEKAKHYLEKYMEVAQAGHLPDFNANAAAEALGEDDSGPAMDEVKSVTVSKLQATLPQGATPTHCPDGKSHAWTPLQSGGHVCYCGAETFSGTNPKTDTPFSGPEITGLDTGKVTCPHHEDGVHRLEVVCLDGLRCLCGKYE